MTIGSGDWTACRVADVGQLVDGFLEGNPLEPTGVEAEFYGGTSFRKGEMGIGLKSGSRRGQLWSRASRRDSRSRSMSSWVL